jgi:glyoxylase-like metal-dependent hydrolase (beta-lactamase superfamily II)
MKKEMMMAVMVVVVVGMLSLEKASAATKPKTMEQLQKENDQLRAKLSLLGFKDKYLEVPATAQPYDTKKGVNITQVAKDVYFMTDSAYTNVIIDIGDSMVLIDAPPSYTKDKLQAAIKTASKGKKLSHFIYTHAHNDHIALSEIFAGTKNLTVMAHEITAGLIHRNSKLPKVTKSIAVAGNGTQMTLGNKKFVFYYYEDAHLEGNLAIWLPQQQILVYVDIVFPQWSPFYGLGLTQDAIRYVQAFDTLLKFDFKYLISGHLGRPASRKDVQLAKTYMGDMSDFVFQGFRLFNNITDYYKVFGGSSPNHWAVLHNWMGDMAFYCARKMIDKYKNVIAGVDIYSWANCWVLREHYGLFLSNTTA